MFVQRAKNSIIFQKRRHIARSSGHRKSDIDRVAKNTCVARIVPGCHGRSIGHREGRHHRMAVRERHSSFTDSRHMRRAMSIDHSTAEPVCNEQHDIVLAPPCGSNRGCGPDQRQSECCRRNNCFQEASLLLPGGRKNEGLRPEIAKSDAHGIVFSRRLFKIDEALLNTTWQDLRRLQTIPLEVRPQLILGWLTADASQRQAAERFCAERAAVFRKDSICRFLRC